MFFILQETAWRVLGFSKKLFLNSQQGILPLPQASGWCEERDWHNHPHRELVPPLFSMFAHTMSRCEPRASVSWRIRRYIDRDLGCPPCRAIAPDRLTPSTRGCGSLGAIVTSSAGNRTLVSEDTPTVVLGLRYLLHSRLWSFAVRVHTQRHNLQPAAENLLPAPTSSVD